MKKTKRKKYKIFQKNKKEKKKIFSIEKFYIYNILI